MTLTKLYPHVAGLIADEGESPTVLAITSVLNPSTNWPSDCRIIIGSPHQSDKLSGDIPSIGGFCMGLAAAEELISTLKQAVSDVRRALGQSAVPGPVMIARYSESSCTDSSPAWFRGRWLDWHRGHGCDKDDGKPRSAEAIAEIADHTGG